MIISCDMVPRGYDAITFWPFILVRPKDRGNAALIEHEEVHYRRQAWITPFWLLAYWLSKSFRWQEEVLGYRAEIKAGGITVYAAAAMLLTYGTGHSWEQALDALEPTP
jgi:hypothetical protein